MSESLVSWFTSWFQNTYNLLTSIYFPGTKWTIMSLLLMGLSLNVLIYFVRAFFGLSVDARAALGRIEKSYGKKPNYRISKERKNDTK